MEENENLIVKTRKALKKEAHSSKLKRAVAGLAVAGAMVLSMGLSACNSMSNSNDIGGGNTDIIGGNTESKYSDILNDVLSDPYYDQVIEDFIATNSVYAENAESPIPYTFLEREGYDVDAIKNDELSCESVAYIMNNDESKLYLSVKAETSAGYYGNYVLSYPLTEKEYDDLYMLHNKEYIQSAFFIQELDSQKRATVESHVNVDTKTFTSLQNRISYLSGQYIGNENVKIDVVSANQDCEFTLNVRTVDKSNKEMISNNKELRIMENHTFPGYYDYSTNVLKMSKITIVTDNLEEFKNNYQSITYFDSQGKINQGSYELSK